MGAVPTDSRKTQAQESDRVLETIAHNAGTAPGGRPVHQWNPPFLGEIDVRIATDGTWYYLGTPIRRERLVRLFSSILRREDDGRFCLVTPVEKFAITVEDAPYQAVEMTVEGAGPDQIISFRTNVDDQVTVDRQHGLRFAKGESPGEIRPYVLVRDRLEALIGRPVFYDLVDLGVTYGSADSERFGVWSSGRFFAMARAADLEL